MTPKDNAEEAARKLAAEIVAPLEGVEIPYGVAMALAIPAIAPKIAKGLRAFAGEVAVEHGRQVSNALNESWGIKVKGAETAALKEATQRILTRVTAPNAQVRIAKTWCLSILENLIAEKDALAVIAGARRLRP